MVNLGRNEVTEFHYASTLTAGGQPIVPAYSTAAAGKYKKIRITDLKVSCGGTARIIELAGDSSNFQALQFTVPANSLQDFTWEMPYPLDTISSTGEVRQIYASAAGAGVDIAVSGYYEKNE